MSVTDVPVSRSIRCASRSRSAVTKSMNRQPVCSLKLREKCHWLMYTVRATRPSVTSLSA
uniref:hypothetical protein n=1 Tax=Streptomyces sp. WZ-12 TaxID=3030210 RepID=UPI0023815DB2|nr:hypothetical protein [Streptomyces sp. WZ-12]